MRQLVTPSGRKVSHEPSDLAEYADVDDAELRRLLERLGRERIVRGVNGMQGAPTATRSSTTSSGRRSSPGRPSTSCAASRSAHGVSIVGCSRSSARALSPWPWSPPWLYMPSSSGATRARRRGMPMAARSPATRSRTSRPIRRSASSSRCRLRSSPPDGRPPTSSARASLRCARRGSCGLGGEHRLRGVRAARRSAARREQQRAGRSLRPRRPPDPGAAAAASADRGGLEPGRPALRNGCVRRQRRRSGGSGAARPFTRSTRPRRSPRCRSTGRRCSWRAALTSDSSTSRPGATKTIRLPRRRPCGRPRSDGTGLCRRDAVRKDPPQRRSSARAPAA